MFKCILVCVFAIIVSACTDDLTPSPGVEETIMQLRERSDPSPASLAERSEVEERALSELGVLGQDDPDLRWGCSDGGGPITSCCIEWGDGTYTCYDCTAYSCSRWQCRVPPGGGSICDNY